MKQQSLFSYRPPSRSRIERVRLAMEADGGFALRQRRREMARRARYARERERKATQGDPPPRAPRQAALLPMPRFALSEPAWVRKARYADPR